MCLLVADSALVRTSVCVLAAVSLKLGVLRCARECSKCIQSAVGSCERDLHTILYLHMCWQWFDLRM